MLRRSLQPVWRTLRFRASVAKKRKGGRMKVGARRLSFKSLRKARMVLPLLFSPVPVFYLLLSLSALFDTSTAVFFTTTGLRVLSKLKLVFLLGWAWRRRRIATCFDFRNACRSVESLRSIGGRAGARLPFPPPHLWTFFFGDISHCRVNARRTYKFYIPPYENSMQFYDSTGDSKFDISLDLAILFISTRTEICFENIYVLLTWICEFNVRFISITLDANI